MLLLLVLLCIIIIVGVDSMDINGNQNSLNDVVKPALPNESLINTTLRLATNEHPFHWPWLVEMTTCSYTWSFQQSHGKWKHVTMKKFIYIIYIKKAC